MGRRRNRAASRRGELGDTVSSGGATLPPGDEAVVDADAQEVLARVEVGAGPVGLAHHPAGLVLVLNRYSNFASVLDVATDEVVQRPPLDFYAVEGAFTPDGRRLAVNGTGNPGAKPWDGRSRQPPRGTRRHIPCAGILGAHPQLRRP